MQHPAPFIDSETLILETESPRPRESWQNVLRAYSEAFSSRSTPGNSASRTMVFDGALSEEICASVMAHGRDAEAGDVLMLDVRLGDQKREGARERLADAFFRGGFQSQFIWAGRDVLLAESRRSKLITRLLSDGALGEGPTSMLASGASVALESGRLVGIARRGSQQLPDDRPWRLSIVMPVYNERATFRTVAEELLAKTIPGMDIELCIVESNSTDGTRDEVVSYRNHPRVKILLEDCPSGKGHAVRAGLGLASGDVIIIQDADLEYDPDDYEKLIAPIRAYNTSFVLGSRHPAGEKRWQIRSFQRQQGIASAMNVGHILFAWLLNFTFRQRMRDPFTMFKVFRRDAIENIRFECNRFDFDLELVGKLIRAGRIPLELDVAYASRSFDEGKKISFFRDPPTWVRACLKHRFSSMYIWPNANS